MEEGLDMSEFPACRYCNSQTHSSQEFELCGKSYKDFFHNLSDKKLGDCTLADVLLRLQSLCPKGFVFSNSRVDNVEAGSDLQILVFGQLENSLRMSQFVSYFIEGAIKGVEAQPRHVINPTGGYEDEAK